MKNHCVSLELARKMKEKGWKKETKFWWANILHTSKDGEFRKWIIAPYWSGEWCVDDDPLNNKISAPLATEILEELPSKVNGQMTSFMLLPKDYGVKDMNNKWCCLIGGKVEVMDNYLPNALAKMWLYLREKKEV